MDGRERGNREVAVVDVAVDQLELVLDLSEKIEHLDLPVRSALELEVGDQTAQAEHGGRGTGLVIGRLERGSERLERGRDRARVRALVEQEARDGAEARRLPDGAAERLAAADRLEQ